MNNLIKLTLLASLGLCPITNPLFAQTNTNTGNSSGTGGTGTFNSFYGYQAGQFNTTGSKNTFIGAQSGTNNTTGYKNIFLGWYAGNSNTEGFNNLFLGTKSGSTNTIGYRNTFVGPSAGSYNVSGNNNVALGYFAGRTNQVGSDNLYLGAYAGYSNLGSDNVFIGNNSGYYETGSNKLYIDNSNTQAPLIYGDFQSNQLKINGNMEVTTGVTAPYLTTNDLYLTGATGIPFSLRSETTTACVSGKLHFEVHRTCGVGPLPPHPFPLMTLQSASPGILGIGTTSPQYALDVDGKVRATQYLILSDKRLKKDVKTIKNAGELLNQLEAVTYSYRQDLKEEGRDLAAGKQLGFIAQEVQKVLPEIVEEDEFGYLSVSYTSLIPLLVENQQSLNAQNAELKEELAQVQENNRQLALEVETIKTILSTLTQEVPTSTLQLENTREEMLFQNAPNPFSASTTIAYNLPAHCTKTQLLILDSTGKLMKSSENLATGHGKVIIEANSLPPGTYHYTLVCQGETIASKSMIVTQ